MILHVLVTSIYSSVVAQLQLKSRNTCKTLQDRILLYTSYKVATKLNAILYKKKTEQTLNCVMIDHPVR